jgi:hypothetical protein
VLIEELLSGHRVFVVGTIRLVCSSISAFLRHPWRISSVAQHDTRNNVAEQR